MNDEELRLNLKNAGKYQIEYLQKNSINWIEFLRSSSNHYSRDFIEQLLITAHYPNATAVMEKELWKSHHYKVNYGENGIAVFKDFNGEFFNEKALQAAEIKVYYDISQVHQIAGTTIARWSLGDVDESIVLNALRKSYSKADTKSLPIAVLTSLESIITEVNSDTKNFIINSSAYQILTRCGYNAKSLFKATDFKYVENIRDTKEFIRIATTVSKASGTMLKLIAKTVRSNYNKNTVSVNKEEKENGINIQSERRYEQGRTNDNLRRVSNGRGWSNDSSDRSQRRETDGTGSIRNEAPEISQGGTSGQIYGADVVGEHNGVSSQHRSDGTEQEGNNNRTTEERTGSNRGTEREKSNEMGRLDEQHNSISRGDSSSRDSLRLSSNPQVNITDNEAEVDVQNQTSAFSISQEVIDDTFCRGNFDNVFQTKLETYQQFEKNLSIKDNAEFLKKQFGTGGGSHAGGHAGYQYMHNAKGFTISSHFDNNNSKVLFTWEQVATRLYQLIRMDRYLNPKEKEYYPKWLEEQAMKEAERSHQEKANEIHPTEEQEYIYQYAVGDKVYLGSSEYEISLISNDGLVSLQDAHFPLVDKEMKREDFESLLKESIFNDHLRKPKSTHNRDLFIAYASNKLIENQAVINAYKNSDIENFKLEVNVAVDKLAIDLLVNQEAIDNLTVDEVREVITEFQNIITVKETIYDTVSTNIDIALMQNNEVSQVDDIDFSDPFVRNTDDELEPTAYDDIATEDTEPVQTELVNSDRYTNYYRIYQLKDTPDYHGIRFQNSARNQKQGVKLNQDDYDLIYEGNWDELKDIPANYRLERIFEKFNTDLPEDFRGHSLSVSDVITVGNEDTQTAYYVDSVGFTDFPEFFKEKELELEQVVDVEPLIQNNIPTITCISSEYPVFEYGKTYSLLEFDELMKNANIEWRRNRIEEFEMYSSSVEAIEATGRTYQHSARTEFKINMPDGSKYIARQDIYEGVGGVIDFLSQDSRYNDILPILKEEVAIERENTPILDVFDTAEIEERLTRIAQTIEADNSDLIGKELKLDRHRYRVEKVSLFGNVSLSNLDFEKEHGFPSTRVEKIDSVRNALKIQSGIELPQMIYQTDDNLNVGDVIHLENQEQPISNTQSVEQDNADLIGKELTLGNRRFRVEKISMFGDVSLRDLEFERMNGFPISRVEKVDFVRNALEIQSSTKTTPTIYKTVDELQVGDVIRLENQEWTISKIDGDFSIELINNDKTANNSVQKFMGHWKENIAEIGFEYIPPVQKRTRNIPTVKSNYIINDDNLGVGTKPERFQNNINAIRLLKTLERENRLATQEEQEILSKYVGWGGLDKYFEPTHSRYNELRECLTDDEFTSASASTLTAFYTPPVVIRAMYKALDNLGFENGNILEPSCGTGNFMGMLPENMQNSKMFGVELDSISGRIAKQLYQKNNISIGGYENEKLPDSFFDVAVGNVPFGNFKVSDKRYNKHKFLIHDYFYAKTLDKVRPGGVIAFITAKGTLDKKDNRIRKYLAERATLLGAIRLPNNTFKGAAGTEVTSDILFLQKKEALSLDNPDWLYLKENEDGIVINQYFVDNPDMVLGDIKSVSGPHGPETACLPNEDGTLEEKLNNAVAKIQGHIVAQNKALDVDDVIESTEVETIPADPTVKNYSYAIVDGDLYFRKNSIMEKQSISGLPEERVRGLIKLRDIVRDLIDYQSNDYPDSDISAKRDELNNEYEKFTKKYGLINSRGNKLAFIQDSSFPLLTSLELLDEDGKLKRKSDIFYKRTIKPYIPVTYAETSIEALAVSLNERGKVDIEYMAKLTGFEQEKVIADLTDIIYPVPGKDEYQTADEYLSGDVRTKLFIAKSVAENDSKYKGNVVALENVQPKDLSAAEVKIRLGATWVDTKYIKQFIDEVFQPGYYTYKINVTYSEYTSKWNITSKSSDTGFLARNTYGTKDYNAYQLLELALNLKTPKVYDVKIIEGQEVKVFNPQKTTVARKKQEKIQEKFEEWIFADPQRRNDLLRKYNDTYNSIRNRTYNGSHLTFPGMNPEITLRPHQVNAIARTLYGGNTLLAHVVGAGKTFEMIASAMEAKRLGLCNKSLFVVPNHLTEQMGSDFLNLYPSANILVATKNDFSTHKRKEFCSRIATGEYDAVIIGHSQFEKIPVSLERQEAFIQEEINDIVNAIAEAKAQNGENFTIKQLEGEKKKLENKMKELYEDKAKDDVVTFEQLGVDRIFVDEAHKFKNLYIRTKMTNVAGITSSSADKSADLLMKCRYIDEITGGKGIVFATGTPVSNSMSELYTMQRYLQFDTLKKLGFAHFDSWASSFGATVTASELAPEGKKYREKTRFSKFFNLPELMNIFRECADIQTADMLNLPVPKAEYKTVVAKPSTDQREFVDECGNRADRVRSGSVDPREDNMLKITTDGRKLAVDQRIVNPELPDFENSKINMCVNNVFEIWQDTAEQRSTQLLFCDLSTPTTDGFNVYDDIREKLISKGIPPKEIAFIHNYNTDAQKAALFSDVRQGKIRVLLGSTEKMGAGTNIQDKLVALHDLDCPWRPSDLEQRLGRILRQGNENEEIYVFRYVTEDTFDAYSYQLIENKQKFISQIMSSKTPVREAEDVDQSALSYAEIKMLATGNPLIKEKMDLDIKQTNLKVLKADYLSNKYKLEDMILNTPKEVAIKERFINDLTLDMATVDEHPINNDEFEMVLNGTTYTDKKTAGMYLIKLLDTLPHHVKTDEFTVGEYRGFTLSVARRDNQPYAYLKGYLSYSVEMSDDIYGNITRLNNKLSAISDRKYKAVLSLEDYNRQMEKVKKEVEKPFEHEAELKNVNDRLEEVNRMLNAKGNSEYRTITKAELELLKDTDVELDFVPDRSGNGDFIIRFEKVESDKVENALKPSTSNSLKI